MKNFPWNSQISILNLQLIAVWNNWKPLMFLLQNADNLRDNIFVCQMQVICICPEHVFFFKAFFSHWCARGLNVFLQIQL